MTNRLASEHSPYLLQHKDNPVDWQPWGDDAFGRARTEDKPIFLSIGYSTCHWCHVMEHESFEQASVAEVLNRHFVSIKVDREERPDVDRVYMTFVQATTGSGGWPMSVWLTPSLEPFYGGTYFPPTSRWGKPGFVDVLEEIARAWRDERGKVTQSASTIVERLRSLRSKGGEARLPPPAMLDRAVGEFGAAFDSRRGGFGDAPKFPRPSELLFLLREHARTGHTEPRDMVLVTLRAMAAGGMRDHLGGGFHRYAVDGDWRVPHFEKMLYDQAQLSLAYLEAAQVTGDRLYEDVAADTLDYVLRDLADGEGGFYSAEDADSVPPEQAGDARARKMEGAFYIWRDAEVGEVLGPDADVFRLRYGVEADGNAPFDPQGEFTHRNLLYAARALEDVSSRTGRTIEDVQQSLHRARAALLHRRAQRPRPHLDDKVLTAWNGLMIAALARAARVLGSLATNNPEAGGRAGDAADDEHHGTPGDHNGLERRRDAGAAGRRYREAARRAAEFIRSHLWQEETGTLLRRYRRGDAAVEGYAEDYAFLIFGLVELFQADPDPSWLQWALALQERQDELFWDPVEGGWFSTTGDDPSVLLRLKEDYDGAEPAASSVSVLNLLVLSHLTGDAGLLEKIERTLGVFGSRAAQMGRAVPMMLAALSTYHAGVPQIVVAGSPVSPDADALMEVVRTRYLPTAVVVQVTPDHQERLSTLLPWTQSMRPRGGRATAYVCRDFTCQTPATDPRELARQLGAV